MSNHSFTVDQTVFVHETWRRTDQLIQTKILKIGRKWVKIDFGSYQFDIHDLTIDGGQHSSPGRVYLAEADYHNEVALKTVSANFYSKLRAISRPGVTVEAIRQAAELLKIELDV